MSGGDEGDAAETLEIPVWGALVAALALLLAIRLLPWDAVFRGGDVVLLSNDPWVFRYLVDQALTDGAISRIDPVVNWRAEPLLIWTLAFVSLLLGGLDSVGFVLAWYPVVTAVVSGLLVFVLARLLTNDVRIGLTAVVVLAVTPLHVSRTALGFADHHAFDYMWLLLAATAFVWLLIRRDAAPRRRWTVAAGLGVAIAGQTLAWRASPLMLVPLVGAFGVASVLVMRQDDPVDRLLPIVAGFGLAAVIVQLVHQTLHWQNTVVAGTPVLIALGGAVVLGLVAAVDHVERSWPTLLASQLAAVAGVVAVVWLVAPGFVADALGQIDAFSAYLARLEGSGIGETAGLTAAFGPFIGPLVLLGFSPFLAFPAVVWGVVRGWREREPAWIVLAVYVVWFLALAFVQRRWAVQLGLFLSVFAGVGFIGFTHWLALVLPPVPLRDDPPESQDVVTPPDRQRVALLGGLAAVGIGASSVYSGFILSKITIDDAAYGAAAWIREYATERGLSYPDNYVLAAWGRVRVYNYLVNGESRSYWYAREHYSDFVFSSQGDGWYDTFRDRVGFVVTRPRDGTSPFHNQAKLHHNYGSASSTVDGLGHFRALWESNDGAAKVFAVVPGATVTGQGPPETELTLETTVSLHGSGNRVAYRRRVSTGSDGSFSVVLAHPGEYEFVDRAGRVTVDESAVLDGADLTVEV